MCDVKESVGLCYLNIMGSRLALATRHNIIYIKCAVDQ